MHAHTCTHTWGLTDGSVEKRPLQETRGPKFKSAAPVEKSQHVVMNAYGALMGQKQDC